MAYGSLAYGLLTGAFTPETTFDENDWRAGGVAFGQPIMRGEVPETFGAKKQSPRENSVATADALIKATSVLRQADER